MEDRLRERLEREAAARGMSAPELSRAAGQDKAYFGDFFAGRKKSVSVVAFLRVANLLDLDPWELADIPRPENQSAKTAESPPLPPPPAPAVDRQLVDVPLELPVSGILEEDAYRAVDGPCGNVTVPAASSVPAERQTAFEVRGDEYAEWGVRDRSIVHSASYRHYESVGAGGLLVVRDAEGGLVRTRLRRAVVNEHGALLLEAPDGKAEDYPPRTASVLGLVIQGTLGPRRT